MKIRVITKSAADRLIVAGLFAPGGTPDRIRLDGGKYKSRNIGREIDVPENVLAVWPEAGRDKDGPYFAFWCLRRPRHE